jgi:hypothetical protein
MFISFFQNTICWHGQRGEEKKDDYYSQKLEKKRRRKRK